MLSLRPNPKQNISYSFYFLRISSPLTCQLSLQHLIKVKQFYFIYISSSLQPPTAHSLFFLSVFTFSSFCFFVFSFCSLHLYLHPPSLSPSDQVFYVLTPVFSYCRYFIVSFCQFFSFIFFLPPPFFPKISFSPSENFPVFIFWPGTLISPGIPKFCP